MAYNLPLNIPLINVMETLKKQFNVEINVLNVNRREGGFLRVFEGGFEGGFGMILLYIISPLL